MGKSYDHISREERAAIGIMLKDGKSLSDISLQKMEKEKGKKMPRTQDYKSNIYRKASG
jgi:hypothetical protein